MIYFCVVSCGSGRRNASLDGSNEDACSSRTQAQSHVVPRVECIRDRPAIATHHAASGKLRPSLHLSASGRRKS